MAKLFVEAIAASRFDRCRAGNLRHEEEPAPGGGGSAGAEVGAEERLRRRAAAGQRCAPADRSRPEGRDRAQADRAGDARPAVRVEGVQAREVECHPVRAQRPDHRRRRGPDEPRGLGEDRRHEVGARNQGIGRRVGRVLSLPRWRRGDRQSGRDGHHSARRLGARSGSNRRREPAGTGDGAHRECGTSGTRSDASSPPPPVESLADRVRRECHPTL